MSALTRGSQGQVPRAGERPDTRPRPRYYDSGPSGPPRAVAARGLLAVFAVVVTTLLVGPDAAHAADSADLWCSLSPKNPKAAPGTSFSVTITCGNEGPNTSTNSLLVYIYPEGTTLGPLPRGWGAESSSAVGIISTLASGETVRATFRVMVPASATVGSGLKQEIMGLPGTTDPNPGNDSTSGQLVIVKASAPSAPAAPAAPPTSPASPAAPTGAGGPPRHLPAKTGLTAATSAAATSAATPSVPSTPAINPGRSSTASAPSSPGADPTGSVVALSPPPEAADPLALESDISDQGSGLSLPALALIAAGALVIVAVAVAVAALLWRRRRSTSGSSQPGSSSPAALTEHATITMSC